MTFTEREVNHTGFKCSLCRWCPARYVWVLTGPGKHQTKYVCSDCRGLDFGVGFHESLYGARTTAQGSKGSSKDLAKEEAPKNKGTWETLCTSAQPPS